MIETAIQSRITGFAGLSALIGTRCYPDTLPEEVEYPAIRYLRIDDPQQALTHEGGPSGLARPRFQFDVYGETATQVKQVAEQLRLCWEGYRGVVGSISIYAVIKADRRGGYEEESNLYRESLDFYIWFAEPTS